MDWLSVELQMQTICVQPAVEQVNSTMFRGLMLLGIPASTSNSPSLFLALACNQTHFVNFQYFTSLTITARRLLLFRKGGQAVEPALFKFYRCGFVLVA
jgi:hypothetical protein